MFAQVAGVVHLDKLLHARVHILEATADVVYGQHLAAALSVVAACNAFRRVLLARSRFLRHSLHQHKICIKD